MRSVKRLSVTSLGTLFFLLVLTFLTTGPVMAAQDAGICPADRINSPGNICTAADVSLAAAAVSVSQTGLTCFPGEIIQVALTGNVNLRKGDRFDIGVWVSTDGKPMNLRGGTNGAPDELGAQSCQVLPLPFQAVAKDSDPSVFIIDTFDSAATPQDCYDTKAANNGDVSSGFVLTSERDSIINGLVDSNNDGVIDISDDTTAALAPKVFGAQIIAGGVDIDNNGVIDVSDDGVWNGYAVQDGVIDVDGDTIFGNNDGSDNSTQAYNDLIDMLCVANPVTGKLALETLVSWHVPSDAANVCMPTVPDTYGDFNNQGDPIMSSAKCSVESSSIAVDIVGKLTIAKIATPDDGSDFEFTYTNDSPPLADQDPNDQIPDISPASPFLLKNLGFDEIYAEIGTGPATIVITESSLPVGWDLDDLVCSGDNDVATVIDVANKTATVTLQYNDVNPLASQADVFCTFVNKTLPSLKIVKNTAGGNGIFEFFGNNTIPVFNLDTLALNTAQQTFANLQPGTDYTIGEIIPPGWNLSSASCSNGSGTLDSPQPGLGGLNSISLALGENVTCTFNNALGAIATITKTTVGGDDTFGFTSDLPNNLIFSLATSGGSSPLASESNLAAGTYTITEDVKAGWELTSIDCLLNGSPAGTVSGRGITITVDVGDSVACTFANEKHATLQINKQTDPNADPATFDFTGTANGTISDNQNLFFTGAAGVFTSDETVKAGWDLTGIACTGATNSVVLIGSTAGYVEGDTGVSATMAPGETVLCVFANTKRGSLTIVKSISATGPASQTFNFTSDIPNNLAFPLSPVDASTDAQLVISDLVPGLYSVTETDPTAAGWALINSSCLDGSPTDGILLDPGEDLICTFNNSPLGSASVTKTTVGGNGQFGFTWGNLTNTNVPEGEAATFDLTTPGPTATKDISNKLLIDNPYDLLETSVPTAVGPYFPDWTLTGVDCIDATLDSLVPGANGADATIVAAAAETVACNFTNTLDGTLVIRKQTLPDQFVQDFTFTTNSGHVGLTGPLQDFDIASAELFETGPPGTYGTAETVPAGWVVSDISCIDAVSSVVTIGGTDSFVAGDTEVSVDIAAGETVICTYTNSKDGSLTIIKDTVGDDGSFSFNHTVPNVATPFVIDTSVLDMELISASLQPGNYMVSEVIPTGWDLTDIVCSGNTDSTVTIGATDIFVTGDNAVTVNMLSGEDIVCTFTNTQQGNIIVDKVTNPADSVQSFEFTPSYGAVFNLTHADAPNDSGLLSATSVGGTYSVSETAVNGWDQTSATCTGVGNTPASITLLPGETVTCTFTNTIRRGSIIVDKVTNPTGSLQLFDFVTFYGSGGFQLADGTTPNDSGPLLPSSEATTNYGVAEQPLAGWDLTSAVCTGDIGGVKISTDIILLPGETVNCVFTNTIQSGNILVNKVADPFGSTQSFDFTSNYGSPFMLTNADAPNDSGPLVPSSEGGTYNVSEALPAGWDQTSATCTGDGNTPASITLLPGETVTCTFTNTIQRGNIVVDKVTDPAGSTQSFDFTPNYGNPFSLTDAATPNDSGPIVPSSEAGVYSVSEAATAGWDQTSATCSGQGNTPASINLQPGETVTCTFTNTIQAAQIIVDKQTAPVDSPVLFDFTLTGTGVNQAFQLADTTTSYNSGDLLPMSENGLYNVSESLPADWSAISATCSDGSDPTAIDLSPGEIVTCTFVNAEAGQSTFTKLTLGGDDTFFFTADQPIGDFQLTTSGGASPTMPTGLLEAGSYIVTEDVLAGWELTDMVCIESADQDSVIDIPNRTIVLNVQEGESINCTVTNTKLGSITVSKVTVPTGDLTGFTFSGDAAGSIADGGTIVVSDLSPGTYSSVEAAVAGWDLTDISCDDGVSTTPSTGDVGTLSATFNLDAGENVICTFTNELLPIIELIKTVNGPATLEANGTFTVVYTIMAMNNGGPGTYNLVDMFSPGAGITLNTATAVYMAGTEDSRTGILGAYPNFVTDEDLDTGLNESWIVTANFAVDPAQTDPVSSACAISGSAINTGFYNAVTGSATETDPTDNDACTDLPQPAINLAKTVNGPATVQPDGTYTVVYTVTASNSGQGPGVYNVVDVVTPGVGISLAGSLPVAAYVAGTESDQSGLLGAYSNFVTGESLAAGLDESWTVTANYAIDPTMVTAEGSDCDTTNAGGENTGFNNGVTGSDTDTDLTDNQDCTELPQPAINLAKTVNGPAELQADGTFTVTYLVTATNTGGPGTYDLIDTVMPGIGITLNVDATTPALVYGGEETQTGTLTPPPLVSAGTWVTDEELGEGATETWTVTTNFTIDPALVTAEGSDCDITNAGGENTGFNNGVTGSATDTDLTDNQDCTELPLPSLNLAKTVNGPAALQPDGTYTVVYTITASNSGEGPGVYDLVDVFTPGVGITLTAGTPPVAVYVAGTESDQSGVLGAYSNLVTDESLASGLNESWTVTANFTIDLALVTAEGSDCDITNAGAENTGFYNGVTGSATDTDLTDNQACTELELPTLTILKAVDGGDALPADFILTLTGADGINDAGVDHASGYTMLVKAGVAYTLSEAPDQVEDYFEDGIACVDDADQSVLPHPVTLADGQSATCTLTNKANEIVFDLIAEVCTDNAPYVDYIVNTTEGNATEVDITWIKDDGSDEIVETLLAQPIDGQLLWPGASVVDGVAVAWPGWSCDTLGFNCTQVDDGLVPTMKIQFAINPTDTIIVNYPPATAGCQGNPPETERLPILPVPVDNKFALLLLILLMLGIGWYFTPATSRKF
jgi:hypothetical protein